MSKNTRNRILLTAVAALLLVVVAVGGTLAYLTATTDTVENTFKPNDVTATLTENGATDEDGDGKYTKEYQFIPGVNLTKDPKVTVTATVDAYVFIKMDVANWPELDLASYTVNSAWQPLTGYNGVYYQEITAPVTNQAYEILAGNQITISPDMTANDMPAGESTMTFQAWAIQKAKSGTDNNITNFTVEEAYNTANPTDLKDAE